MCFGSINNFQSEVCENVIFKNSWEILEARLIWKVSDEEGMGEINLLACSQC